MKYICPNDIRIAPLLAHEYGNSARRKATLIRKIWKADTPGSLEDVCPAEVAQYNRDSCVPLSFGTLLHAKMAIIDKILHTHGVEYLGRHKRTGEPVHYCNAGDPYTGTLLFRGARMFIGCWGDLVEKREIDEGEGSW